MSTRIKSAIDHNGYYYVDYDYVQDIAGNYTDVTWTAGVHWGSYYWSIHNAGLALSTATSGGSVTGSGGFGPYNSGWPISGAGTNRDYAFWSNTTRIHHNGSGDGSIKFVGSANWDTPGNFTGSINTTVFLPRIPSLPGAPSAPAISSVTSTSVFVTFTDGSNGGGTINSRQIGYGTNPSTQTTIISSDGSTAISGLTPGTTYYFWARTHNAKGYSPWSSRTTRATLSIPEAPSTPTLSDISPTAATVSWTANGDGGSPITGFELGYGTSLTAPTTIISATSPKVITGLTPGTVYYFWVRATNSIGTSAWSTPVSSSTIAGGRVRIGGVWKIAIPYVKVAGVWTIAHPWARSAGVWKETI